MTERPYVEVDDPTLPCPYCVGWRDDPDDDQNVWPVDTKGNRIPVIYAGIHPSCQRSVDLYMAELEAERKAGGPW